MATEDLSGKTESDMRESLRMTEDMDKASLYGVMEGFMMEDGRLENSMVKEYL